MDVVIFAEDALAPGDRLWRDAVEHLARKLGRVTPLDPATVSDDRCVALPQLEAWAGDEVSSWRLELARFYEEHIPVYVRPDPALNGAVRQMSAAGVRIAAWSPGPPEVGAIVSHFLGLSRRFELERVESSHRRSREPDRGAGAGARGGAGGVGLAARDRGGQARRRRHRRRRVDGWIDATTCWPCCPATWPRRLTSCPQLVAG